MATYGFDVEMDVDEQPEEFGLAAWNMLRHRLHARAYASDLENCTPIMRTQFGRSAIRALSQPANNRHIYEVCPHIERTTLLTAYEKSFCKTRDRAIAYTLGGQVVGLQKPIGATRNGVAIRDFTAIDAQNNLCSFYAGECFATSNSTSLDLQSGGSGELEVYDLAWHRPKYIVPVRPTTFMLPEGSMPERTRFTTALEGVIDMPVALDVRGLQVIRGAVDEAYKAQKEQYPYS